MSESKLRVALDVTPLLGVPTGVHQATAGLLDGLRARSDVDVSGYVLSFRAEVPAKRFHELRVTTRRFPAALAHRLWARTDIPTGRWLAGPADVIHGTNYTTPPDARGRLVTVQDLTIATHPDWCTPDVARMYGALKRAVARGAHVHVTSESTGAEAATQLDVPAARVHVVPNAVTPLGPGDAKRGRALVGAEDYVVALGTTERRKGLSALPEAVAQLDRRINLAVVGPSGPDEPALDTAVSAAGISDRYRRIGVVDAAGRSDIIRGATVLVYPSLAEGFGFPPLEALAVGRPVVATAVGALPELIGDLVDLIPPADPVALVDALREVVASPPTIPDQLVKRLSAMTWDRAAEQMVAVYRLAAG